MLLFHYAKNYELVPLPLVHLTAEYCLRRFGEIVFRSINFSLCIFALDEHTAMAKIQRSNGLKYT